MNVMQEHITKAIAALETDEKTLLDWIRQLRAQRELLQNALDMHETLGKLVDGGKKPALEVPKPYKLIPEGEHILRVEAKKNEDLTLPQHIGNGLSLHDDMLWVLATYNKRWWTAKQLNVALADTWKKRLGKTYQKRIWGTLNYIRTHNKNVKAKKDGAVGYVKWRA